LVGGSVSLINITQKMHGQTTVPDGNDHTDISV
jgi:hypothetical protein